MIVNADNIQNIGADHSINKKGKEENQAAGCNIARHRETKQGVDEPDDYGHPDKHENHIGKENLYGIFQIPPAVEFRFWLDSGAIHG